MDISDLLVVHADYARDDLMLTICTAMVMSGVVAVAVGLRAFVIRSGRATLFLHRAGRIGLGAVLGALLAVFADTVVLPAQLEGTTARGIAHGLDREYGIWVDRHDVVRAWNADGQPVVFQGFRDGDFQDMLIHFDEDNATVMLTTVNGTELAHRKHPTG